jgi:hypothetical protein
VPAYWSDDARHEGGASLICCFCVEREKACSDTALCTLEGEREPPKRQKPLGTEYRRASVLADLLVVAAKSLLDAVGMEPRGRVIRGIVYLINRALTREESRGQAEVARQVV